MFIRNKSIRLKNGAPKTYQSQSGFVFLLLIVSLILAGTALFVGQVSRNKQQIINSNQTQKKLQLAQDALLGYALLQTVPGTLPCPDSNGDGDANYSGSHCTQSKGWLPFRSLGLDDLRDLSGEKLWYVIDPAYAVAAAPFNSSTPSLLSNGTDTLAFAVLAPNAVIGSQSRSSLAVSASNYLEGANSDSDPFTVAYQKDDAHNDQLLSYSLDDFWYWIEKTKVLPAAIEALSQYQLACGVYPWAATFAQSPFDSLSSLQIGSLPTHTALPSDGSTCPNILVLPAWFSHWEAVIAYQFCLSGEGQCLSVTGDEVSAASLISMAPGVVLSSQNRSNTSLINYFEGENSTGSAIVELRTLNNHDASFNDVVNYLP